MTTIQTNHTDHMGDPVAGSFKQTFKAWRSPQRPPLVVPRNDFEAARKKANVCLGGVMGVDGLVIVLSILANLQAANEIGPNLGTAFAVAPPFLLGAGVTIWHFTHDMMYGWANRLITAALLVVAIGCGVVSFGHIQDVVIKETHASSSAVIIVPLAIDVVAVIMAGLAVVILNHRKRIDTAELEHTVMVERNEAANQKRSKTRRANEAAREAKKAVEGDFTVEALRKVLTADPGLSNKAIAARFGVSARTVAYRKKQLNGVELKAVQ